MKLIKLTEKYKNEWENLINEFEISQEKLIPFGMKGNCESFLEFLIESENNSKGINLAKGIVPSDIYFLVRNDSDYLIGAIDIRHYLNEGLLKSGGNIGYGIRPSERNKGYATQMLALALEKCKEMQISKILITCSKDNIASANVIIKNGGILENEIIENGIVKQRYWISRDMLNISKG